jgi:hypothetical protein
MSETDIEIAWRSTVEDARAYMRGKFFSPADGTLAHEVQEYARKRMTAACESAYRAGANSVISRHDPTDGIPYLMVGAAVAFLISAVM